MVNVSISDFVAYTDRGNSKIYQAIIVSWTTIIKNIIQNPDSSIDQTSYTTVEGSMFERILFLPVVPPTVNFSLERSETSSIRKGNESSFDRSSHDERKKTLDFSAKF